MTNITMDTILKINTTADKFIAEFESSKANLFGDVQLRASAMESFQKLGVPGRKSEEYKYVNMELVLKGEISFSNFEKISASQITTAAFLKDAILVVVENGKLNSEHSKLNTLPKGVTIQSISDAASNAHYAKYADVSLDPFAALNTALASGGVFVHVAKGAVVEAPIHILHINGAKEYAMINVRNLIVAEENAQAKIVESFTVAGASAKLFNNALTEIFVAANANVRHYKIQDEKEQGQLVNTTHVCQQKQSVFTTNNFTLSGTLVRNNLTIVLDGEHIESHLNGLYLTKGNQNVDNHTLVDHRKPNCNSNELYKGIIEERSTATFNGKIYVRKDAQKTNAFQSNKNILLSDDGTINTKPQLEIYADDVKCSHGTSTGKLDEDKIFYLRARGLSEASAKKLLMHAFASEVVDGIEIEALKEYVEEKIAERFM